MEILSQDTALRYKLCCATCPTHCDPMDYSPPNHWNGLSFPSPGDLPDPGIKPASLASPALAGGLFTFMPLGKP